MNRLKICLLFTVFTLVEISDKNVTFAQGVDNQFWINYAVSIPINKKWSYGGDMGLRGFISNYSWNQILIRPNVSYRINNTFGVSPAVAWFSTFNKDIGNVNEFRIHQDVTANWPDLGFIKFFYRVRLEQRFFFFEDEEIENRFNIRLRGLIGFETADIKIGNAKRPIYFQSIFEGFTTVEESAGEVFVNQTRFHLAFGHRLSSSVRYELHYIRQGSRVSAEDGINLAQNILRVRFFHRINNKSAN